MDTICTGECKRLNFIAVQLKTTWVACQFFFLAFVLFCIIAVASRQIGHFVPHPSYMVAYVGHTSVVLLLCGVPIGLDKKVGNSHMSLDMAFVRAVLLASALLGEEAMPVDFISTWPPPECDAGLGATS